MELEDDVKYCPKIRDLCRQDCAWWIPNTCNILNEWTGCCSITIIALAHMEDKIDEQEDEGKLPS